MHIASGNVCNNTLQFPYTNLPIQRSTFPLCEKIDAFWASRTACTWSYRRFSCAKHGRRIDQKVRCLFFSITCGGAKSLRFQEIRRLRMLVCDYAQLLKWKRAFSTKKSRVADHKSRHSDCPSLVQTGGFACPKIWERARARGLSREGGSQKKKNFFGILLHSTKNNQHITRTELLRFCLDWSGSPQKLRPAQSNNRRSRWDFKRFGDYACLLATTPTSWNEA